MPTVTIDNVTYLLYENFLTASAINVSNTSTSITIPNSINNDVNTFSVTSIGDNAFKNNTSLLSVIIGDLVTSVGTEAFNGCTSLTSVTVGISVVTIGSESFKDCSFTSISIPDSVVTIKNGAFNNCKLMTSIIFNSTSGLTTIEHDAFDGCWTLPTITIPNSVTDIQYNAFRSCYALTSIIIPNSVVSIGTSAFEHSTVLCNVVIGNSVTAISNSTFKNCWQLTSVAIGSSVNSIGSEAFLTCLNLPSITIPSTVTSIGDSAFKSCGDTLTSMYFLGDLPSSLGSDLFLGDVSLTLYYLDGATNWPSTVGGRPAQAITAGTTGVASITNFNNSAKTATFSIANTSYTNVELVVLNGDSGVTSGKAFALSSDNWTVTSPALVDGDVVKVFLQTSSGATVTQLLSYNSTTIDGTIYDSVDLGVGIVSIGQDAFERCSELTAVTIGANVTSIGNDAFRRCSALTAVTIGASVTTIGQTAFAYCIALTGVTIPDAVTTIGNFAFYGCSALTAVTIGASVTTIGQTAFAYCIALTGVTIPDAVTSIGNNAFTGCIELTAVTIGSSVTSIGEFAFDGCTELTSMYFLGDLPSSLGSNLFLNDESLNLYYLDGATGWSSTVGERPAYPIPTITSATTPNVSISSTETSLSPVYVYTSTSGGTTWTTNSVAMSSGYGTLTDLSSGTLVSTIANIYHATTYADYCKTVATSTPIPSSNVCFPAKTPIMTNCGPINIEDIDPVVHTIRNKKIVAITKTVAHDKNLVRIAKHALGHLYPEKTTFISQNHKVFFQGQMVKAKHLVDESRNVTLVPYNGQVLYNVLLEQYEKMQVNNLIVETLHPEHKVAKLYRFLQNVDVAHHGKLIALFNKKDKEHRIHF